MKVKVVHFSLGLLLNLCKLNVEGSTRETLCLYDTCTIRKAVIKCHIPSSWRNLADRFSAAIFSFTGCHLSDWESFFFPMFFFHTVSWSTLFSTSFKLKSPPHSIKLKVGGLCVISIRLHADKVQKDKPLSCKGSFTLWVCLTCSIFYKQLKYLLTKWYLRGYVSS